MTDPARHLVRRAARRLTSATRTAVRSALRRCGPAGDALYYAAFSGPLRSERRAVAAGVRAHHRAGSGAGTYVLRRNVHMIEKGLTMRPRRPVFAVDYIGRTVRLATGTGAAGMSEAERAWVHRVLDAYFAATHATTDPAVRAARERWQRLEAPDGAVLAAAPGPAHPAVGPSPVRPEDLLALAERRRSVRWFLDRPVDREVVDLALRVAAESPSACNRQPYRFEILDDPGLARSAASLAMGTAGYVHQLPALAVLVGDLSAFREEWDRHLVHVDGSLAAMSFLLALETQGVATCCLNWPSVPFRERAMARLLGLEAHERVVMLIAFGHPDPEGLAPGSQKRALSDVRTFRPATRTPPDDPR